MGARSPPPGPCCPNPPPAPRATSLPRSQSALLRRLRKLLLSGLIFRLTSIAAGVRWIAYFPPLTYFNQISRGVMLRAEPITSLWQPFVFLALLGVIVVTGATLRFRSYLAPATREHGARKPAPAAQGA